MLIRGSSTQQLPFNIGSEISFNSKIGKIQSIDQIYNVVGVYIPYDNSLEQYTITELVEAYKKRELSLVKSVSPLSEGISLTQSQQAEVKRRLLFCEQARISEYPTQVSMLEGMIPEVAKINNISAEKVPSPKTVQRWFKQWKDSDYDMIQVIVKNCEAKKRTRLHQDIEDLISQAIESKYMREGLNQTGVYEEVKSLMTERGYLLSEVPDKKTVDARIRSLDRRKVVKSRDGDFAHRELTRGTFKHHPEYACLERVEADVMHLNIGVLDVEGYYIGSLSIAFCLDVGTRAVVGYALMISDKKKETASFILSAFLHSIIKKNNADYPYGGIAFEYALDNGPGYRDRDNKRFIESSLKSLLQFLPTRKGWGKPFVESSVKSFRQIFGAEVSGYLGKYEPTKFSKDTLVSSAKWTIDQIEEKVYRAFLSYHQEPMDALKNKTPHQVWLKKSDERPPCYLEHLPDSRELRPVKLEKRSVSSVKGAFVKYQTFHNKELQDLVFQILGNRKDKSVKLTLEVNYFDARAINVINPVTGERIEVPNTQQLDKRYSFDELNSWRNGIQKIIESETTIESEKRIKLRAKKNRRGPSTSMITPDTSEQIWDEMLRSSISPHEYLSDHEKDRSVTKQAISLYPKSLNKKENTSKASRYESKSEKEAKKQKKGGFDAI